jgi:hypothetical protein
MCIDAQESIPVTQTWQNTSLVIIGGAGPAAQVLHTPRVNLEVLHTPRVNLEVLHSRLE